MRPSGALKILILDDATDLMEAMILLLETMGHESEGTDKVEIFFDRFRRSQLSGAPFDVVIIDAKLPGQLDPQSIFTRLRSYCSGTRAILTSGNAQSELMTRFQELGFHSALPKPFNRSHLEEALKTSLLKK